jgi:putative transposase
LNTLQSCVPLEIDGRNLDEAKLWDILIYSATHRTTIEASCTELQCGCSSNTVRAHLNDGLDESRAGVVELEEHLNTALHTQLPDSFLRQLKQRRYDTAIDLVEIAYHGQPSQVAAEVRRGPAKSGTTHRHAYATLAIVHDEQRYELALTFVWADETLVQVVERLLKRAWRFGLRIRRAYCDKGFCSCAVFRWLRHHRVAYVIPVPVRGKALKALRRGDHSYRTRYTFNVHTREAYTTDLVLVRKYRAGRRGKHGVDWLIYAVYAVGAILPQQIHDLYRRRFGIESGYRQLHQVRARTTSQNPAVRLLLVGLALLILNVYLALRRIWLTVRHFGRRTRRLWLTLKRLALMLFRLIEHRYGVCAIEEVAFSTINL